MKKRYYIVGVLLLLGGLYWIYTKVQRNIGEKKHREWVATLAHTASENVAILPNAPGIEYRDEARSLNIYLPPNYTADSVDYPVIYFMDGQSLFDQKVQEGTEWQVDEVLDSVIKLGGPSSIVVGIYSGEDRMKEYKPFPSTRWYSDKVVHGDHHADWIVNKVKPYIDANYRTKSDARSTVIGGASLGGLMSYYMLMEYPDVFGGAIVFSPSFWVSEKVYDLHKENREVKNQKIYFNAGELETPTVESIQKMEKVLLEYGVPADNIRLDVELGEGHWHMSWRKGFKKVYPWIVTGD